jgi:PBP1b-binding outer membrane lipoprotein LpoB
MNKFHIKLILPLLMALLAVVLGGCSDEKADKASVAKTQSHKLNHVEYGEASDSVKAKFIKEFSNKCVNRELKNSVNKDNDQKRFEENCSCIAKHISDNLADVDAEKYLQLHEDTQALDIKFDTAAYFCLQAKSLPKGPHLFGKE